MTQQVEGRRPEASRGAAGIILPLVMIAVALGVLRVTPIVAYQCAAAETGARCVVRYRYAGLFDIERHDVEGIRRATASDWTDRVTSTDSNGRTSTGSESKSEVKLFGADDAVLFSDIESGATGSEAGEIADHVNALVAGGRKAPFLLFQSPALAMVFASLFLLIALPTLIDSLRRTFLPPRRGSAVLWLEFLLVAVPLLVGWLLMLVGELPPPLAAALGLPEG